MKIYLVGGAVRDRLLGRNPKDLDYVVVGSSPQEMLDKGFKEVGSDFPVFLHPESGDEYALARTEIKEGKGYKGFKCSFGPEVTLEEDLSRRDLTINAIAYDPSEDVYIDPFKGWDAIKRKSLCHVSNAFSEDPLRVLRIARFASELDFNIDTSTRIFMSKMSESGELSNLTAERVFKEMNKALASAHPAHFFNVLRSVGALEVVFPELHSLILVPEDPKFHEEKNTYIHTMNVLSKVNSSFIKEARFAALTHDFGKALSPKDQLPAHHGHAEAGISLVERFCDRLHVPSNYKKIAVAAVSHHMRGHLIDSLTPKKILKLLNSIDAFRNPKYLYQFIDILNADKGFKEADYALLERSREAVNSLSFEDEARELKGSALVNRIHQKKIAAIKSLIT